MRTWVAILLLIGAASAAGQEKPAQRVSERVICTMVRGKVLKMVKPVYPAEAAKNHMAGEVTLDVDINERGEPTLVRVSSGSPEFAQAALDAVRQWRWRPLRLNGQAVPAQTTVRVSFQRNAE